ncbi:uncharacterized protein LOC131670244 isoform X2 [Phymastichus coffea]|uniref:uncharacterized protein LOC131670244 isoform X2 n=1 Tax=Phymastichus coffea TaxID=108790 RepID=UPI00273B2F0B|nr:uncharacterized protein LOC131670244 isoform X2 [Phymastichus coffea]
MEVIPNYKRTENIDVPQYQANVLQNPIENYKRPVDKLCLIVFGIAIAVWMTICTLGIMAPLKHANDFMAKYFTLLRLCINAPVLRFSYGFILSIITSVTTICLCTFLIARFTKFFIKIGVGYCLLATIILCFQTVYITVLILSSSDLHLILSLTLYVVPISIMLIYLVVATFCYLKTDKSVLSELIKDSYQAILCRPSIVLFVSISTVLLALLFSFAVNALLFNIFSSRSVSFIILNAIIILFGAIFVTNFYYSLVILIVTEYANYYYWKKDENASYLLRQSVANALRNHIKSITFMSTPFMPIICTIIQAFKHTRSRRNNEHSIVYFVSKVNLMFKMPEIALIFMTFYRTGYVKSVKTAFEVVLRRSPLFLATFTVCDSLISILSMLTMIGSVIVYTIVPAGDPNTIENIQNTAFIIHGYIYPMICFTVLVSATVKTMLINKIIILNKEEEVTQEQVQKVNYA